jgi:aspartyl protease family protein
MGSFHVTFELGDPLGQRWRDVDALVDTGASFTWVPVDALADLGVTPEERWEFQIADGNVIERDVAETLVRYDGRERTTIVVFGDVGSTPLLGAYTLEGFKLAPDPVNQTLIPVRPYAM